MPAVSRTNAIVLLRSALDGASPSLSGDAGEYAVYARLVPSRKRHVELNSDTLIDHLYSCLYGSSLRVAQVELECVGERKSVLEQEGLTARGRDWSPRLCVISGW